MNKMLDFPVRSQRKALYYKKKKKSKLQIDMFWILVISAFIMFFFKKNNTPLIFKKNFERKRKAGEREISTCCSTYLCIHWLILVCPLTGDQTCNLGESGWRSTELLGQGCSFFFVTYFRFRTVMNKVMGFPLPY